MEPAAAAVKARRSIARTRKVDYGIAEKYAAAETLCHAALRRLSRVIHRYFEPAKINNTRRGTRKTWEVIVSDTKSGY